MRIVSYILPILIALAARLSMAQGYEIPRPIADERILTYSAYTVSFNDEYKVANWVAYVLTNHETVAVVDRFKGRFKPEPRLKDKDGKPCSPDSLDYLQSGYDRGHLAPAADMEFSELTMQESFYYTNIAPQNPALNRGVWKRLECLQRLWAKDYDSIYIVTGPVLKGGRFKRIGPHRVAVARYFYKVMMRREPDGRFVGAGFVFANRDDNSQLRSRMISIDSVEAITGIDFFYRLPDEIENPMERVSCRECWKWHKGNTRVDPPAQPIKDDATKRKPNDGSSTQPPKPSETWVQCNGTTKAGKRCTRRTADPSGYCYQHKK